jgi:tetratricopeptide (TPR) repeat protein
MLDHYTHSAYHCALLLLPTRDPIDLPLTTSAPGVCPEQPFDYDAALNWFDAAYHVLLAVQRHAADIGSHPHAWQLAWALDTYLGRRAHRDERLAAWQIGLRAADALGLPVAQAHAHRRLGYIRTGSGAYDKASADLRRALDLYRQAGDLVGQAYVLCDLARLDLRQGRHQEARDTGLRALELFRAAGHRGGQAEALNAIGWYCIHLGDHADAVTCCEEALALLEDIGLVSGQAHTWDTLGYAHHHLGRFDRAAAGFQRALDLYRELGDLLHEADTLVRLGSTHAAAGDPEAARSAFTAALDIYDDLDPRSAARTRAELAGVTPPDPN